MQGMIMRVLCSVSASRSHAIAMLPVVRAMTAAGHEVLVVAPPSLFQVFEGEAVRIREGLLDVMKGWPDLIKDCQRLLPPNPDRFAFETAASLMVMCGPHLDENYRTLLPVARDFEADLVARDGFELTGCLVAEAMAIPHVSLPSGSSQIVDPVRIMPLLNERRRDVGLPIQDDPNAIYRHGRLDAVPPRYSFAKYPIPDAFSYTQPPVVYRDQRLPPWLAELPADRPLVMASIGSAVAAFVKSASPDVMAEVPPAGREFNPLIGLQAIVAGLSQLDCLAVVAAGGLPVGDVVGKNVHVVDYFAQPTLLECAQLFVTHGGYNSIRESIRAGVPMAVLPHFADQFHNADRVQALGLGLRIPQADPEHVASTCRTLLESSNITAEARRAQRAMLALPPVEAVVDHLEKLVRQTRTR
jgi:UDP:flavonoid glycosyltransferase YjiC (YdhE family)